MNILLGLQRNSKGFSTETDQNIKILLFPPGNIRNTPVANIRKERLDCI